MENPFGSAGIDLTFDGSRNVFDISGLNGSVLPDPRPSVRRDTAQVGVDNGAPLSTLHVGGNPPAALAAALGGDVTIEDNDTYLDLVSTGGGSIGSLLGFKEVLSTRAPSSTTGAFPARPTALATTCASASVPRPIPPRTRAASRSPAQAASVSARQSPPKTSTSPRPATRLSALRPTPTTAVRATRQPSS